MRILIATDAWHPQVNGVVRTLTQTSGELRAMGHEVLMVTPDLFPTVPCPTYSEIRLAYRVGSKLRRLVNDFRPESVHISTEGPIGFAMRRLCVRWRLPFTTAYHTRFPEYIQSKTSIPTALTYSVVRRFHAPAKRTMVPTPSMQAELQARGFAGLCQWTRGVDVDLFHPRSKDCLQLPRPIFMNVGRVSVEKNLSAFLSLELPGSKVIVGDGPQFNQMRAEFPDAHFLGKKQGEELAQCYAAADVFVFPSLTDTYGLVVLEALASGVPVAAYPVTGPKDVIGDAPVGCLHDDLRSAALSALTVSAERCREFALTRTWRASAQQFFDNLYPFEWQESAAA